MVCSCLSKSGGQYSRQMEAKEAPAPNPQMLVWRALGLRSFCRSLRQDVQLASPP